MLNGRENIEIESRISSLTTSLTDLIQEDPRSMIWIGSGLSIGAGYPSWQTAIERLCAACIPEKFDLPPSLMVTEKLEWAEKCKTANPEMYFQILGELFGWYPTYTRTAYSHICACPFRYLVTTNFDPCLEAARGRSHGIMSYPKLLFDHGFRHMVVYLHGKALHGNDVDTRNLVFTSSDFEKAYTESLLPGLLDQLLIRNSTLFVGCGLQEPVLKRVFARVAKLQADTSLSPRRKMILLCDRTSAADEQRETDEFQRLGIGVLRYPLAYGIGPDGRSEPHRYLDQVWARVRTKVSEAIPPSFTESEMRL